MDTILLLVSIVKTQSHFTDIEVYAIYVSFG